MKIIDTYHKRAAGRLMEGDRSAENPCEIVERIHGTHDMPCHETHDMPRHACKHGNIEIVAWIRDDPSKVFQTAFMLCINEARALAENIPPPTNGAREPAKELLLLMDEMQRLALKASLPTATDARMSPDTKLCLISSQSMALQLVLRVQAYSLIEPSAKQLLPSVTDACELASSAAQLC